MALFKKKKKTDDATESPLVSPGAAGESVVPTGESQASVEAPPEPVPPKPKPKPDTYTYALIVALIALMTSAVYLFLATKYYKDTQHKPLARNAAILRVDDTRHCEC